MFVNSPSLLWWQTDLFCFLVTHSHSQSAALSSHFTRTCLNSLAAHTTPPLLPTALIATVAALGCSTKGCQGKDKWLANLFKPVATALLSISAGTEPLLPVSLSFRLTRTSDFLVGSWRSRNHAILVSSSMVVVYLFLGIFQRLCCFYWSGQWKKSL